MKIISLSKKFGATVGHRTDAAELREEVLVGDQPVQLDFSGVKVISYSFAEEFFGKLVENHGPEILGTRIILKNIRPESQSMMTAVIQKHEEIFKRNRQAA